MLYNEHVQNNEYIPTQHILYTHTYTDEHFIYESRAQVIYILSVRSTPHFMPNATQHVVLNFQSFTFPGIHIYSFAHFLRCSCYVRRMSLRASLTHTHVIYTDIYIESTLNSLGALMEFCWISLFYQKNKKKNTTTRATGNIFWNEGAHRAAEAPTVCGKWQSEIREWNWKWYWCTMCSGKWMCLSVYVWYHAQPQAARSTVKCIFKNIRYIYFKIFLFHSFVIH